MIDFCIFTLGCKVNQTEGQSLGESIAAEGYSVTFDFILAHNYIINTCSVTGEADKKSRQCVARALKMNASANIFVVGCSTQFDANAFMAKPNVRLVAGTANKTLALAQILEFVKKENPPAVNTTLAPVAPIKISTQLNNTFESLSMPFKSRTRAYIKVQDGCNRFCTYCIVPYLRGRSRSRNLQEIISEAAVLSKTTQEIVITGICLSDYTIDDKPALVDLIKAFKEIKVRKRIGSLYPDSITQELLLALQESGFCNHFHLSIQSGSDGILKRMGRKYTAQDILDKVALIRQMFPDCSITSDIIAGFGGETQEEFSETVELLKTANFSDMHVFPYSERKGTKAADMPQIAKPLRRERAKMLQAIASTSKAEFLQRQIGKTHEVYIEESGSGYTTHYIKVYTDNVLNMSSPMLQLKITATYKDGLWGEKE